MRMRRLICHSGAVAMLLTLGATLPSHAQLTVFDPTQSVHAIQQIYDRAQDAATWRQQLSADMQMAGTLLKDYQQAVTTYNMLHGNLKTSPANRSGRRSSRSSLWRVSLTIMVRRLDCKV